MIASREQYAAMLDAASTGRYALAAVNVTSSGTLNGAMRGFAEADADGVIEITTAPTPPPGTADLRALDSDDIAAEDMKVFVNSHAHLVPQEVWRAYLEIVNLSANWKENLELYSINTVVLDNTRRRDLGRALKRDEEWRVGYEDNNSIVLVRRKPL